MLSFRHVDLNFWSISFFFSLKSFFSISHKIHLLATNSLSVCLSKKCIFFLPFSWVISLDPEFYVVGFVLSTLQMFHFALPVSEGKPGIILICGPLQGTCCPTSLKISSSLILCNSNMIYCT